MADKDQDGIFDINEKLIPSKDVMGFLNISRTTLWELTKKGEVPAYKIGGEYRYKISEIKEYLEKSRVKKKNE